MIKTWYNIRSGYIIKYIYDTKSGKLKIGRQSYQRIKNVKHNVLN